MRPALLAPLTALLLTGACATLPANEARLRTGTGTVIDDDMISQADGSVLTVLEKRVAGMSLRRNTECPGIILRGQKSVLLDTSPLIYVAGQRAANTCVLETINGDDVSSIEVYPNGVTMRPGYQMAPGGLILVFLKNGQTD